ncbi:MAG: hypothetical protein KGL46_03530 [Hyphomicrobiales bacterium]|nr:hypothetical protein [Hyphomicrobiales bacterium]
MPTAEPAPAAFAAAAAANPYISHELEMNAALRSLGSYHESLRARSETTVNTIKTFRSSFDEMEALIHEFGKMARAYHLQSQTVMEQEQLLRNQAETAQKHLADLQEAQAHAAHLSGQLELQNMARTNAEQQASALDENLRGAHSELKDKTAALRTMELELAAARAALDNTNDDVTRLTNKLHDAEKVAAELGEERRGLRERLLFESEEHMKLSKAHEDMTGQATQKKRELLEALGDLQKARAEHSEAETRLAQTIAEADGLRDALRVSQTSHQEDVYSLNLQADALKSRVRLTEQLLQSAREEGRRMQEEQAQNGDMKRRLQRAEAAVEELRSQIEEKNKELVDSERSRDLIVERANELVGKLREKQALNDQAADRIRALQETNAAADQKRAAETADLHARIAKLTEMLEKERSDRAYVEGALQIARRDRTQLQGFVSQTKAPTRQAPLAVVEAENNTLREAEDLQRRLRDAAENVESIGPASAAH